MVRHRRGWAAAALVASLVACSSSADEAPAAPPDRPAPSAQVTLGGPGIDASTYNRGSSFQLTNDSPAGQRIARVRFDLSTSLLPDLVFDPDGEAGDTLGKGFTVDRDPGVGAIAHRFERPHDRGYDALTATFTAFGPGKTLAFSVDIDPTSIVGAEPPGPGEAGSVSGLELTAATVTVTYGDGTTQAGRLFRSPGSLGQSQVRLDGTRRPVPVLAAAGSSDAPAIRVTAPAGARVRLLAVGSALFTSGLPAGGFDLDPDEANSVVSVAEHPATVGAGGSVDIPVTLTAGSDRFVAVVDDHGPGPASNVLVIGHP